MELRDLESYGEPGAIVYRTDCLELMGLMPPACVDVIFADPPYRLSGGVTVKSGRLVPVDKGGGIVRWAWNEHCHCDCPEARCRRAPLSRLDELRR